MIVYRQDPKVIEKAREARREYYREWRAANRDKVKRYNATYWARKAEKQWGKANSEKAQTANAN